MKEFENLSVGDLYQATLRSIPIYDAHYNFITHISRNSVVILVDDCYYFVEIKSAGNSKFSLNMKSFQSFQSSKDLDDTFKDVYIKIAFNEIICYANFHSFVLVNKS